MKEIKKQQCLLDGFGRAQKIIMTVNCEFLIERVFIEILTIPKKIFLVLFFKLTEKLILNVNKFFRVKN